MEGEFFSEKWEKDLSFFKQDVLTLRRLLHRNANQHKRTLGFSYLHRILRLLSIWKVDQLLTIRKVIVYLRSRDVLDVKVSQAVVDQQLLLGHSLCTTLTTATKAITYIHKAFQVFSKKLASQVFVPLFAFIWAWLAKMFRHLRGMILPFHEALTHCITQLKQVACISKKHAALIESQLVVDKLLLPPQSIGVIELLKTVLREKSGLMSIEEVAEEMIDGELSEAVLAKEASTMQTVQAHDEEGFLDIESDDEGEEIGKLVTASSGMTPILKKQDLIRSIIMGSEKSSTIQDNMTSSSSKKTPVSTAKILNKVGIEDDVEDEGEDVPVSLMSSPAAVTPVAMKKAKPTSSTSITSSASKVSIIKVTEDMSKKLIKASKKEKTSTTDDAGVKKRKAIDIDQSSGKKKKKVNSNKVDDIDNIFNML